MFVAKMNTSRIAWTTATWNPVTGCTKVSPGCDHCYAETFAERFRGVSGHIYERGFDFPLRPDRLKQPLSSHGRLATPLWQNPHSWTDPGKGSYGARRFMSHTSKGGTRISSQAAHRDITQDRWVSRFPNSVTFVAQCRVLRVAMSTNRDAQLWRERLISVGTMDQAAEYEGITFAADLTAAIPSAFRVLRTMGMSSEDAEDALQDASIRAWRHRTQCRGPFGVWFMTIATREARRARPRWLTLPVVWTVSGDEDVEGQLPMIPAKSLAALPRRQRLALSLRYEADLPIAAVAGVMGISEPAAKQLLSRARDSLRQAITVAQGEVF